MIQFASHTKNDLTILHVLFQVCLSLGHLLTFLNETDLELIQDNVIFFLDLLKNEMRKVLNRLVPEKASVLIAAAAHLNNLLPNAKTDQMEVVQLLISVLTVSE